MELFDKQFVHFMWDAELTGKFVFYSDYSDKLKENVENNYARYYVESEGSSSYPFIVGRDAWAFVYYDPNYEIKVLALKGKTIQVLYEGDWIDCSADELWKEGWQNKEFRVSPEENKIDEDNIEESKALLKNVYVTNRELAKWLSQGNGEWKRDFDDFSNSSTDCTYSIKNENEVVEDDIFVRRWEDTQWHVPTREYMGLED